MSAPRPVVSSLELLVIHGDRMEIHGLPERGSVTIGRSPESTVRIDDRAVSRRHAVLHVDESLRLEDLGTPNGVHLQARGPASGDTAHLRPVIGESLALAIGSVAVLGTSMLVVRRRGDTVRGAETGGRVLADPTMQKLDEQLGRGAGSLITVLILGETGSGKEVLAHELHRRSQRASGPFLAVNCGALTEALLESELFGHERGAFTGAVQAKLGLIESADGGTLFLDEVGELPPSTQVKLLRVLEDRQVLRVGARSPVHVDVRFVAATNRDLDGAVQAGSFRRDLFYRLAGFSLSIPPLRERRMEIAPLCAHFLAEACQAIGREDVPHLATDVLPCLESHDWPGNVRELRNVIERAVVLCQDRVIHLEHLPATLTSPQSGASAPPSSGRSGPSFATSTSPPAVNDAEEALKQQLRDLDRERIVKALEESAGNQTEAARRLGISRRTLVSRLGDYALPRPRKGR